LGDYGIHSQEAIGRKGDMDKNLTFRYDRVGDILYIDLCPPYAEQESEEIGDEIIARLNPDSNEVENLEILFFSKRLAEKPLFELPIVADLKLAG
jgi:uncharacterized protein YuzE